MAAQALYRRWRPQTFDDVVGQSHILQTLRNALTTGRIAHAYLFAGPRGTGKTTIARILAKAVNCTAAPERRPCGECAACRSLGEGRSMDLIEIDAASHTGVDNVRDLIEKVQFSPSETQYKVYIIDEVHMLSTPAFNALLKTLEEPPPHALFFLATTESHKIPATILSRCQRFNFTRHSLSDTVDHLAHICATEGFQVEPGALELIARTAQGGMRDAISLLDQMVAFSGETVTLAQVQSVLGTAADAAVEVLVDQLVAGDTAGGLRLVNQSIDAGVDPRQLVNQLLEYLRGLMLIQTGSGGLLNVTAETLARMETQARLISMAALVRSIRLFTEAAFAQRGSLQPQLPLELAVVETTLQPSQAEGFQSPTSTPVQPGPLSSPSKTQPVAEATSPAPKGRAGGETLTPPAAAKRRGEVEPAPSAPATSGRGEAQPLAPDPAPRRKDEPAAASHGSRLHDLLAEWDPICAAINRQNKSLAGLLKDCYPLDAVDGQVSLGVYYPFHQKQLEEVKKRDLLEQTIGQFLGGSVRVTFKLTPKSKAEIEAERPKNPLETAADDPVVKEAVKMGGKITGITLDS